MRAWCDCSIRHGSCGILNAERAWRGHGEQLKSRFGKVFGECVEPMPHSQGHLHYACMDISMHAFAHPQMAHTLAGFKAPSQQQRCMCGPF